MNWKFWDKKPLPTPEEIAEAVKSRADREAASIVAQAERRKKLTEAGKPTMSAAILLIRGTSWAVLAAAAVMTLVGYWYDGLFYWQQSDNLAVQIGLLGFALTLRTLSVSIPVVLQWAKPDAGRKPKPGAKFRWPWEAKADEDDPEAEDEFNLRDVIASNRLARASLRALCIASIVGCAFATLSFFTSGHETRQATVSNIAESEAVKTTNIAEQIKGLEGQIQALRDDRDKAVATAQSSIDALAVDKTAANDGPEYTKQYTDQQVAAQNYAQIEIAKLNKSIGDLRTGKQTAEASKVDDLAKHPPFLGVYKFLGDADGEGEAGLDEKDWTVAGAWFFTILFECIIAFLLGAAYAVLLATNGIVRWITAQEASKAMKWELKIAKHEADARLESHMAQAARASQEAAFNLELTKRKAAEDEQRAEAEREIAEVKRKAKEAQDRLDAILAGEDPDTYDGRKELEREKRKAEADRVKAEAEREIAKIKAETEKLRKPDPELTKKQQDGQNGSIGAELTRNTKDQVFKVPAGDWSKRPDRQPIKDEAA